MKIYGKVYLEFLGAEYEEIVIAVEAYLDESGYPILGSEVIRFINKKLAKVPGQRRLVLMPLRKSPEAFYDFILSNLGEKEADNFFNFLRNFTFAFFVKWEPEAFTIGRSKFEVVKGKLHPREKNTLKDIIKKGRNLKDVMDNIGWIFYDPVKARDYSNLYRDTLTSFNKLISDLKKLLKTQS